MFDTLTDMATRPDFPKQCSMVAWKELAPLSLELTTMRRIVQSTCGDSVSLCNACTRLWEKGRTVIVKDISRTMPITRPACRKAYGCPTLDPQYRPYGTGTADMYR